MIILFVIILNIPRIVNTRLCNTKIQKDRIRTGDGPHPSATGFNTNGINKKEIIRYTLPIVVKIMPI